MKKIMIIFIVGVLLSVNVTINVYSLGHENYQNNIFFLKPISIKNNPFEIWNKTFGGDREEYAMFRSLKHNSDDTFFIISQTNSFGSGNNDIWLIKTDLEGNELWNRTYGGSNDEWPGWLIETAEGGYILIGTTFSYGVGESDIWLIKIDSNGNIEWDRTLGGSGHEWGQHIFHTNDGYFIGARTNSFGAGQYDNWLVKTDENGNIIWDKTIGTRGAEWGGYLIETLDGGYASIGYTTDPSVNNFDMHLIKIDENGNELWSKTFDDRGMEHGHGLCQSSDGGYILTGLTSEYWGSEGDIFIVKTDQFGNEIWSKTIGGSADELGNSIIMTSDNNYLITGSLDSDLLLLKIDDEGNNIFSYKIGGEGYDSGGSLLQLTDENYIISGYTNSYGAGDFDIWLLKLAEIINDPPEKPPIPSGPSTGKVNEEITYSTSSIDPNGDQLFYMFDWGEGHTSFWYGPYDSGEECTASNIWFNKGSYEIKVKAQDIYSAESDWSDPLEVNMPKTYSLNIDNPRFIINDNYKEISEEVANLNVDYDYIERDRIIDIAIGFLNHEWYPTEDNIFHGKYMGWTVDTPDRDTYTDQPDEWGWKSNQLNTGVPYQWGGFSSISGYNLSNPIDFDQQYTGTGLYNDEIHYGGDIYTDKNFLCNLACGLDCSGFVSRCWNLPVKHGTYTLPETSSQIRFSELERGDVLNIPRYHVILFVEFIDAEKTQIRTIEEGGFYPSVNEQIYNIRSVSNDGFFVTLEEYPRDREFGLYRYDLIEGTPLAPIISGPTNGVINNDYNYNLYSIDPENEDIYYYIDWGDDNSENIYGPFESGANVIINHTWASSGTYEIRAKSIGLLKL